MDPLLRVTNVSKSFSNLPVLQQVSFDVRAGEVVGLTGSIGSGKSVLMMLLAGLYEPDEGEIYFGQKRLRWPFSAQSLGIGVIHQRPTLVDQLDLVSNIFLANEIAWPKGAGPLRILDHDRMIHKAAAILTQLGVEVDSLMRKASELSADQRQMIAIARVLTLPLRIVLIDEFTMFLNYPNQQRLFNLIQTWREQGVAVIFSSNNLDHLFAVTDRIMVLHQTHKVADLRTDENTRETVVNLLLEGAMPGRPASTLWDFDSYSDFRKNAERLRYHQMLLEKDLASEDSLNRQLTRQMADQVRTLDQVNTALLEAQRRLMTEREEERKHLARELHDQVIQDLLSINYELEGLETEDGLSAELAEHLSDARASIREQVDSLREICRSLRPPTIDSLGLGSALLSYTRDWSARSGIQVNLDVDENLGRLPEDTELSLFRIIQEGLSNVRRHAQASSVQITLQHTSPRSLMISLLDDGDSMPEDIDINDLANHGHFGLLGISERVALLGGRFRLQRPPEGGLLMVVEIPHPRIEPQAEQDR
jgi:signal transduction histidine kinase